MKKYITVAVVALVLSSCKSEKHSMDQLRDAFGYIHIKNGNDACLVYPKTIEDIKNQSIKAQCEIRTIIDAIIKTPVDQQNKHTMIYQFDRLVPWISVLGGFEFVQHVYSDDAMRTLAGEESTNVRNFYTDHVTMNVDLYNAFKAYYEGYATTEVLEDFERYFLDELMKDFKRSGLDLPEDQRKNIAELTKKVSKISQDFSKNISDDTSFITATKEQLPGVSGEFIQGLEKDDQGLFILRTDYPTSDMISNYCSDQETRKRFFQTFSNKAYPCNKEVLDQLIAARNELAVALGFVSYADLDLSDQMIKSAARAWDFENDLKKRTLEKAKQEFKTLTEHLPEGVVLSPDGKMYPWDGGYISTYFKKKNYDIDERVLAEYFPMEKTVDGLMDIYQTFFNLKIVKLTPNDVWHSDVQLLQIIDANTDIILGYVFLDMYPRPKKYNHAAQFDGVTAYRSADGMYDPGAVTVVCNFTKPTATKPSLLKYGEVNTFFHEFGHALHSVLGGARLASQSGTNVKRDFVELPSQMLENWLEDASILKNLSCHYQTGEKMPDDVIAKKLDLLKFGLGKQFVLVVGQK